MFLEQLHACASYAIETRRACESSSCRRMRAFSRERTRVFGEFIDDSHARGCRERAAPSTPKRMRFIALATAAVALATTAMAIENASATTAMARCPSLKKLNDYIGHRVRNPNTHALAISIARSRSRRARPRRTRSATRASRRRSTGTVSIAETCRRKNVQVRYLYEFVM